MQVCNTTSVIFVLSSLAQTQLSKLWFALSKLSTPAALMLTLCSQRRGEIGGQTVCDNSPSPSLALDMGVYTGERMSAVTKSVGQRGNGTAWV